MQKTMFCVRVLAMQDIVKQWKRLRALDWRIVWHYFHWYGNNLLSLRDETDETIYTSLEKYMRWFMRQSIKGVDSQILINTTNLK